MKIRLLFVFLFLSSMLHAQMPQPATTTYEAETGRNVLSVSPAFTGVYNTPRFGPATTNGNAAPGNISKVDTRTLLYPGAQTKIYVELQAWFCHNPSNLGSDGKLDPTRSFDPGCQSHIDIGSNSTSQTYMNNAVAEMRSRGIQGAILNWYGQGHNTDAAAQALKNAAEANSGFEFAIMIDKGAFNGYSDRTARGVALVQDVMSRYVSSPAYIRDGQNRPMIFFFVDKGTTPNIFDINWTSLHTAAPSAVFLGDKIGAFDVAGYDGAYAWVEKAPATYDPAQTGVKMLGDYYRTAVSSSKLSLGATFKGFNDKLASWCCKNPEGTPRINYQRCGMTWLDSFRMTNAYYHSGRPLPWLQIVTWDDYEEGSEIETGIDNCVSAVEASVSGTMLRWSTKFGPDPDDPSRTGSEETVDHYKVFINAQGGLIVLQDNIKPGLNELNLANYSIPPGTYSLNVKAVGKPSIRNHMSRAVPYNVSGTNCSVTISSPASGATVTSPVRVIATATPQSGASIATMTISLDGQQVWSGSGASLDQSIAIATPGSHIITVRATDSAGRVCAQSISVTIPSAGVNVSVTPPPSPVTSPVPIAATATSDRTITGWRIYVDGVDSFSGGQTNAINASVPMSIGAHTVVVRAWDASGAYGDQTLTVNVTQPGVDVTVSNPASNATVQSPAGISASATSSRTITGWRIYVDDVERYSAGQVNAINASISMSAGWHTVVVRAWDASGAFGDETLSLNVAAESVRVTVSSPANGATVSSPATISASATSSQTITGWKLYVDDVEKASAGAVTSVSFPVTMESGTHTVVVRAWNAGGTFGDQTLTLHVVPGVQVSVSAPVTNQTVASPVTVNASATSSRTITGWRIYANGVDKFNAGQTNSISASIPLTAGAYTLVVRAWDASGAFGDQTVNVNVVAGVTVNVSTPASNSTVASPVSIAASATSGRPITGWHIYVDGADRFSAGAVSSVNASIPMTTGTHTVVIRAWDASGAFGDKTLTLNVANAPAVTIHSPSNNASVGSPVTVNASASGPRTITGWKVYVDGVERYSGGQVNAISPSITMSAGTRTVVVRAWDSGGAFGGRTITLYVH